MRALVCGQARRSQEHRALVHGHVPRRSQGRGAVHRVRYAAVEAWEGTDQVRFAELKGRRLTLTVGAANTGVVLSWKRVDSGT